MLSCKQVMEKSSALVDQELDWRERWGIRLHVMMCRHCRRFTRQLKQLVDATEHLHGQASDQEVARVMSQLRVESSASKDAPSRH